MLDRRRWGGVAVIGALLAAAACHDQPSPAKVARIDSVTITRSVSDTPAATASRVVRLPPVIIVAPMQRHVAGG